MTTGYDNWLTRPAEVQHEMPKKEPARKPATSKAPVSMMVVSGIRWIIVAASATATEEAAAIAKSHGDLAFFIRVVPVPP